MYPEISPISNTVASYLPNTLQANAPTAYSSVGLMGEYLPQSIQRDYTIPSNVPPYIANYMERVGWTNPDSLINRTRDEFSGARNGFRGLGFDKKASTLIGGLGTIYGMYNAHQQMKLAKQQLAHNKMESERNYQAQRKMTNSQLEDRQKRRVEEAQANGRSTTSVADYMAKYAI